MIPLHDIKDNVLENLTPIQLRRIGNGLANHYTIRVRVTAANHRIIQMLDTFDNRWYSYAPWMDWISRRQISDYERMAREAIQAGTIEITYTGDNR